jgi:transcriptional regulator with XRE-family HTH domain
MRIHMVNVKLSNQAMPTIDEIRRINLAALIASAGGNKQFSDRVGVSESQLSQWVNGSSNSATGRPRGMRTETAQRIERAAGRTGMNNAGRLK